MELSAKGQTLLHKMEFVRLTHNDYVLTPTRDFLLKACAVPRPGTFVESPDDVSGPCTLTPSKPAQRSDTMLPSNVLTFTLSCQCTSFEGR